MTRVIFRGKCVPWIIQTDKCEQSDLRLFQWPFRPKPDSNSNWRHSYPSNCMFNLLTCIFIVTSIFVSNHFEIQVQWYLWPQGVRVDVRWTIYHNYSLHSNPFSIKNFFKSFLCLLYAWFIKYFTLLDNTSKQIPQSGPESAIVRSLSKEKVVSSPWWIRF